MQIQCSDCWEIILSNFLCSNSFICPATAAANKGTTGMSLKSSIGPGHFISEIATFHVCKLKKD